MKDGIRACVARHGFDLCRFARPDVSETHQKSYQDWIATDMHGDMAWMAEESRLNRRQRPESMLDGVQTVITVGMRYSPPSCSLEEAESRRGRGVIAAYAHGDDYHELMKKRLKALARDLDSLLGEHNQRVYVDTAPVLEHALAEASGLGWQGKHSLTINRKLGSWFLLGELFTTVEVEPDTPAINHCGTCTACMDICPTKAIVSPYVVDARLCISYLTIEYGGFIPRGVRPLMGNRIFGCDDCQAICPWNRYATSPDRDLLNPRGENCMPELASLLALDEEGFRARFRRSPVKRAGRAGLLRNVCIAMGNSGDAGFVPLLVEAMRDNPALVRAHAAWALARLAPKDGSVLTCLRQAQAAEQDKESLEDMSITIEETWMN